MESSITTKGQITIPKALRDRLELKPGDRVKFFIDPHGHLALLPSLPASAARARIVSSLNHVPSLEEMDRAIDEGMAAEHRAAQP